jgi:hypothetical protein
MKTPRPVRPLALSSSLLLAAAAFLAPVLFHPAAPPDAPRPAPARTTSPAGDSPAPLIARPVSFGVADGREAPPAPKPRTLRIAAAPDSMTAPALSPPGAAGMVIGLDPETGTWGAPTREQLRELAELRRLSEGDARRVAKPEGPLPEVRHPDGHVSVELDGQFQEFTTVRIGPDGKPVFTCAHGPDGAAGAVAPPAAPAIEER